MKDAKRFSINNGPVSYGSIKVPGVYILHMPDTNDSYVGQSINLGVRIRSHLHITSKGTIAALQSLKQTQSGSVETCIIDSEMISVLITKHGIALKDFLDILEQYVILITMPSLNTLYLIRGFGTSSPSDKDRTLRHPNRQCLYIYKVIVNSPITLIYEMPSIGTLGKVINLNPDFARGILKAGGLFRDEIYCSTTPVINTNVDIITKVDFIKFFQIVLAKSYRGAPKPLYLINALTNVRTGPYPSVTYVCKHVLMGASPKYFKPNRITPYRGFYIEYVNKNDE